MTQRVGVVAREVGSLLQAENRVGVVRRTPGTGWKPAGGPRRRRTFFGLFHCFHTVLLSLFDFAQLHFFITSPLRAMELTADHSPSRIPSHPPWSR